ncbi:MAG: ABC transporter ATP-binding protein [Acidimicrobiia bacterium]|nr:ABC transporter ATP-binding protein [Acidimicrobiia bacterium]RZV42982.1 MAG: ABC transporter ATP-binding protein [Acidimicrobiia bacterium]
MGPVIQLRGVEKVFRTGRVEYPALRGVDLEVGAGELVAVVGPSGSGKSTILNIITGIDRATAGDVLVTGRDLGGLSEEELAVWRGDHIGIVFQFFQLLPTLTAIENVMLPLDFARTGTVAERSGRARRRLAQVGLEDKTDNFPAELSGGEQQRVAIARALACDPAILVADEPTGNLDSDTAAEMFEVFGKVNSDGTTIVYVTHDPSLAREAHRVVTIRDGRVGGGGRA